MQITTKLVLDLESGETILRESYQYSGPVAQLKASSQETSISNEQAGFYSDLMNSYNQQFANQSNILSSLQSAFSPILAGGIGQQGYTAPELAALRTSATDTTAQGYQQARMAVDDQMAAAGGGNVPMPSGAAAQINSELAAQFAGQNAAEQLGITQNNYTQGRANFLGAASALSGAAGLYNPEGFMGGANSAGSSAFGSANTVNQQNQSSLSGLGTAIGAIGGAALGSTFGDPQLGGQLGGALGGAIGNL